VVIGHHGEAMLQFMKPGFRSGTLTKLFAKLRRANRKAYWTGKWKTVGKHQAGLNHAELELRRFVDRDLRLLLAHSHGWQNHALTTGHIELATNRILAELRCEELSPDSLWLSFAEQNGWLIASVHKRGWLDALRDSQRATLDNALAGFYKMAGVDLARDFTHLPALLRSHAQVELAFLGALGAAQDVQVRRPRQFSQQG